MACEPIESVPPGILSLFETRETLPLCNQSNSLIQHDASPTNALSPCSLTEMTPQSVSSISEVGTPVKVEVGENF